VSIPEARRIAKEFGFPIMLKAEGGAAVAAFMRGTGQLA
jgi:biotin carboxylase